MGPPVTYCAGTSMLLATELSNCACAPAGDCALACANTFCLDQVLSAACTTCLNKADANNGCASELSACLADQ